MQDTSKLKDYRYFIGNPNLVEPLEKGKVVYLPCKDNYENLSEKTLLAIKWAFENKEFDLLLKADDDVEFLKDFDLIVEEALQHDYCGVLAKGGYDSSWHFGKCEDVKLNTQKIHVPNVVYCRGGAYFLSKKATAEINEHFDNIERVLYEDVTIGNFLKSKGIIANRVNLQNRIKWTE